MLKVRKKLTPATDVLDPLPPDPENHSFLRSEVNIELNFPPKLRGARSRLYRRQFLQVNTRWKALAEIYTMHSFAPFWNRSRGIRLGEEIYENKH